MIVKQVSVFLENKTGRLNEVTQLLGDAGLNMSAFTIADTSDFGILRLIVSDPDKAKEILKKNKFSVQTTEVILVKSPNRPGGLAKMLNLLQKEDVFIEYMYAFSNSEDTAVIVLRPTDLQKCMDIFQNHRGDFLVQEGQYLF
ncbi:MAG TPA: amino acid-binding protein [Prolixibacteraceae bacterium]|nr:amino acid-binding protein [Prolixibacteraceae bacterium]